MNPATQFWTLQTALPALALALLIGGFQFGVPRLFDAGIMALAASAILSGASCIRWRRVVVPRRWLAFGFKLIVYEGNTAYFAGAALLVLGLGLSAAGAAHLLGMSATEIRGVILARPGLALAPAGFILLAMGIGYLAGFPSDRRVVEHPTLNLILSLPDRLGGAILSAVGSAALIAGAYELLDPQGFDRAVAWIQRGAPW